MELNASSMPSTESMNGDMNIISAFLETARLRGDAIGAYFKHEDCWETVRWNEMAQMVRAVAEGLRDLGIRPGDRIAICAPTSFAWTIADMGILASGAISVPIYSSLPADRIAAFVGMIAPSLAFISGGEVERRFREALSICGLIEMPLVSLERRDEGRSLWAMATQRNLRESEAIDDIVRRLSPADVATIVSTSGTMGEQKGVVITHGNLFAEIGGARQVFHFGEHEVGLQCLPLAHVLGRLMQLYCLVQGCPLAYAEGIEQLARNYTELRPHFLCGVPRMLEKVFEIVQVRIGHASAWRRWVFRWSLAVGERRSTHLRWHKPIGAMLSAQAALADILVFKKIRAAFGGRLTTIICGGAPLAEEVSKFFHACGILVLEGWGLTETFAAAAVNRPDDFRFGTVGKAVPGVEISLAADREILVRGPTVFREYYENPTATREALTDDDWFRTGDLGEYSRDGFLRVTGRKKDILVTAGGKNVSPQMIEMVMAASPLIGHFVVYGDGRKFLTGIVVLDLPAVAAELARLGHAAPERGKYAGHPVVGELIARHVADRNRRLAPFETIKKYLIVEDVFSVATGELTPTFKVRRPVVDAQYRARLEALYRE